jgi:formate dehydrogenase subunit beta
VSREVQEEIRGRARRLLDSGEAKLVIGWGEGTEPSRLRPLFATSPDEADRLVTDERSVHNLAAYLVRAELEPLRPIAIVAKPEDIRSVVVLVQEDQISREDVRIIGVRTAPLELLPGSTLEDYIRYLDDEVKGSELGPELLEGVRRLEGLAPDERLEFWLSEFDRCIRCYACREACPLCYCRRCIVDENQPQWVSTAPSPRGNLAWNLVRAMHLAGRCVLCGACERACPAGIPLMLLNRRLAETTKNEFDYIAGYDPEAGYCYTRFDAADSDEIFR